MLNSPRSLGVSFNCINFLHEPAKGKTSKKAKAEPTKDDMHAVIVDILKEVDFNTVSDYCNNTLSGWLKLCELYYLISAFSLCRQLYQTFSGNLVGLLSIFYDFFFSFPNLRLHLANCKTVIYLGTHFGIDLMHRKAEVKDIITEVINNMSDEEDEGDEAEEEAEAGDDADKDEEKDDNDEDDA